MVCVTARAFACMRSGVSMKETGPKIKGMEKVMNDSATAISTLVTILRALLAEKDSTLGLMATHTTVNGSMASSTATVSGKVQVVIATSVSGSRTRLMATDSTSGAMVTSTRESGTFVCAMVKALTSFKTAISISESTHTAKQMDMDSTDGRMVTLTRASLSKG